MNIIYTCPKCGADLYDMALPTNPPIYKKQCLKCGWVSGEKQEESIRIPYYDDNNLVPSACMMCPNHPTNGGSGVCHCILGSQTWG